LFDQIKKGERNGFMRMERALLKRPQLAKMEKIILREVRNQCKIRPKTT
jgi:hypothetical protein